MTGVDAASTEGGGLIGLNVGTLTLGVVGSGVTLVDEIENLEVYDTQTQTKAVELQCVGAVAAVGAASVSTSRRSQRLARRDVGLAPSTLAAHLRSSSPRRALAAACDRASRVGATSTRITASSRPTSGAGRWCCV